MMTGMGTMMMAMGTKMTGMEMKTRTGPGQDNTTMGTIGTRTGRTRTGQCDNGDWEDQDQDRTTQ